MIYTKRLEKAALIARVAPPCVLRRTSSQFGAKIQNYRTLYKTKLFGDKFSDF